MEDNDSQNNRSLYKTIALTAIVTATIFYPALYFCERQVEKQIYGGLNVLTERRLEVEQPEQNRAKEGSLFLIL
ncbi:MAG: hypothetical protein WCI72_03010 [archaeon]